MAFIFKLQLPNGEPIERFTSAVPNWRPGDPVVITPERVYLVVDVLRYVEELTEITQVREPASLASDLLSCSLGLVNWHEIAAAYADEYAAIRTRSQADTAGIWTRCGAPRRFGGAKAPAKARLGGRLGGRRCSNQANFM